MTWEEDMARRTTIRRKGAEFGRLYTDPHRRFHHPHHRGNLAECSCGEVWGVFTIGLTDEPLPPSRCVVCGMEGVDYAGI